MSMVHRETGQSAILCPYPNIAQTLRAVAQGRRTGCRAGGEFYEGSVAITLDMLWQLDGLQIQMALVTDQPCIAVPCSNIRKHPNCLFSPASSGAVPGWLEQFLPTVQLIPANSTTEALQQLEQDWTVGAISSFRASQLYNLPVLASLINDYPTTVPVWVISQRHSLTASHNACFQRTCQCSRSAS